MRNFNWKNLLNSASAVIVIHSYYLSLKANQDSAQDRLNSENNQAYNNAVNNQLQQKLDNLTNKIDSLDERTPNYGELKNALQESMDYMEKNKGLLESLENNGSKTYETLKKENPNIDFESLSLENAKIFERLQKALNDFNNNNSNNSNNNLLNLNDYINAYKDWFNSFTLEQQHIIFNIIILGIILSILFSLIITYYSDYLIKNTKIEENYPRLGKFIQLRRKLQNYYFFMNSIMLIAIIVASIALNIYAFTSI